MVEFGSTWGHISSKIKRMRHPRLKFFLFIILPGILLKPALAKPENIVSLNLCTDQLLMLLADHDRIASVSYLAVKKETSAMAEEAFGIPLNHGKAEEIMIMKPELVLAGAFTSRPTVFMLKKLGYKVIELPVARHLDDIRKNIKTVADAIGEPQRGKQMIAAFDLRLAGFQADHDIPKPIAVFYRENSYTTGGHTLANSILEAAGFINLAKTLGISGSGHLPLETLITQASDIIILGQKRSQKGAMSAAALAHPAFKKFANQRMTITISDPDWVCGTPFVLDAIENLATIRKTWQKDTSL
jgi:iron complex transport system substrate-binding protein